MTAPSDDIFHEIERSDETAILEILKLTRLAQDFRTTDELCQNITRGIVEIYKAYYHVSIFMANPDRTRLEVVAIAGESATEMDQRFPAGYSQPIDVGVAGHVLHTGRMHLSNDVTDEPLFVPAMNTRTKSELCLPIHDTRTCIGGLNIESDKVGTFTATDVYLFEVLAHAIGSSIARDRLTKELLEATGALGALGAASEGAIVVMTPDGHIKYGNSRFLPFRNVEGLCAEIQNAGEGTSFKISGGGGELPEEIEIEVLAERGGYVVARVR